MSSVAFKRKPKESNDHSFANGAVVGTFVSISDLGIPNVEFPGNTAGPIKARVVASVGGALTIGDTVLLLFEQHDATRPLIVGKIADTLVSKPSTRAPAAQADVTLDGRSVVLEAQNEVVLRCGKGSITLLANGKIIIKGTELISRSSGIHKIRGALVNIN